MEEQNTNQKDRIPLNRKQFLRGALVVLAGGVLAACEAASESAAFDATPWRSPTADRVLMSPQPAGTADVTVTPEGAEADLARFLALSAALTGVENLNPGIGQVYLSHLQNTGASLQSLYQHIELEAGRPLDLQEIEAAGVFEDEGLSDLADQIIELWYTGQYQEGEETIVVTFVDALAWKAIRFTKPPTICGSFGFWAEQPKSDVSWECTSGRGTA